MKEHPILFSAPMVRAILDGHKTQTRRVVTTEWGPGFKKNTKRRFTRRSGSDDFVVFSDPYTRSQGEPVWLYSWGNVRWLRSPYGVPGDRLWVRETWAYEPIAGQPSLNELKAAPEYFNWRPPNRGLYYKATSDGYGLRWRPSIHMPRWASCLTLEVVSVRVERVQEISASDAKSEGTDAGDHRTSAVTIIGRFAQRWNAINGKKPGCSWKDNPWVWVIEFNRVSQ